MADLGPYDIEADGVLMLPQVPMSQTAGMQNVSIDWVNDVFYTTQVIKNGVQLPGEPAPVSMTQRSLNGDLAVTRFTSDGTITGVMYVLRVGHGVPLNAEPVGADTYLWMEAVAQPDGTQSYGTQVGRVKFVDGAIVYSSDLAMQKFNPIPGFRRVWSSIDFNNNRIAVSYADLTSARQRRYRIYDFEQFKLGNFVQLVPEFPGKPGSLQNSCLVGDFVYQLEGASYSDTNPPPGNSFISVIDFSGNTLEKVFIDWALDLTNREPEALNLDLRQNPPTLFMSFSTNAPAPIRFLTLYYWSLRRAEDPNVNWTFRTPTVSEAPFAWSDLMVRYRMDRGISIQEVAPCQYEKVRYYAYTDELGAENLPQNPNQNTDFWPAPSAGLNFFRGGYDHLVDSATKDCIIASGVADETNFTLTGGFGSGGFGEGPFGG